MDWADFGSCPYPINIAKMSYSHQAPAAPASFAWTQELDQYGFPNVALPTYRIDRYLQTFNTESGYVGKHRLKWDNQLGQTTVSFSGGITNLQVFSGTITQAGGDLQCSGSNGYAEFNIGPTQQATIKFETAGATWNGTARNFRIFRSDDATDEAAEKLVRQEFIDKAVALGITALRFMDGNGVNNGCQALWKYRRKTTDFAWFGDNRIPAGVYSGAVSGTNNYTANLAPDNNSTTWTDGESNFGIYANQQSNNTQATFKEGTKSQKNVVSIGGGLMNNASGAASDTIKANINGMQYCAKLDACIWLATNFQQGFGMVESMPYEVCAEICIRAGIDCYICIPTLYTSASIQSLGALMGGLFAGTGIRCFIELGNELWNGLFGQAQLMYAIATALGFTAAAPANGDVNLARFSAQGLMHRQAMEAFATGWVGAGASMNYLKRVLGVQNAGSVSALKTYCFEGVQLGSYGYNTVGNRPIDYTDIVATAPYDWGGTMLADYHWTATNLNSTMLTAVCAAADAYAGGDTTTGISYVDGQMRNGNAIGGSIDTNSLDYVIPTQMKLWDDLIKTYNPTRTSPLRIGCYEGFTQIRWPSVDQLSNLGVAPGYGTGTGTAQTIWETGKVVGIGAYRTNASKVYISTTSGTTGPTAPTHTSGTANDGAVTWQYIGPANIGTVGGDKIKNMVLGWRASSLAKDFAKAYYDRLMALPNMVLPGQYTHFIGVGGSNWYNQAGFYSAVSPFTQALMDFNAKPKRLFRANGS
ncbi:hypothetical protein [Aestuariivirga sp.]|uniref:hypothetical protein n=1 Tax=Aestuariivirga sp. TaxID=2650926 RepID=UPI0039E35C93